MHKVLLQVLVAWCLFASAAHAAEVEGLHLEDKVRIDGGQELVFNGAGVRSKMFIKAYVGALYLVQKKTSAEAVLADRGQKRVVLHILRDEVPSDKMMTALHEGLSNNNSQAEMAALEARIKDLGNMLSAVKIYMKGTVIGFDFLQAGGTRVSINGEVKGTVPGEDFNRALLKVWLGDKPVDGSLKKGMLGG